MKTTENRLGCDCSNALNSPTEGSSLVQTPVGPRAIIVCGVLAKDPIQVSLAEHDQAVEAFPPDRANQSLRAAILPFCVPKIKFGNSGDEDRREKVGM